MLFRINMSGFRCLIFLLLLNLLHQAFAQPILSESDKAGSIGGKIGHFSEEGGSSKHFFDLLATVVLPGQFISVSQLSQLDADFLLHLKRLVSTSAFVRSASQSYCLVNLQDRAVKVETNYTFQSNTDKYLRYVYVSGKTINELIAAEGAALLPSGLLLLKSCSFEKTALSNMRSPTGFILRDGKLVLSYGASAEDY